MDTASQKREAEKSIVRLDTKKLMLFGYVVNDEFQVDIKSSSVIKLYNTIEYSNQDDQRFSNYFKLRETMMRLLLYLLENASFGYISNEEIMVNVWENYNLSSSSTRLTQVMSELKTRLATIGIDDGFIKASRGKGYTLQGALIVPLYSFLGASNRETEFHCKVK
ncbi:MULTISPECIES: winged helix-turn-helix domain-containing protein [unclassified Serratia (in: enterobacteria)]|uniref:winged helix-turn-helix domain-containing protein n=1 Tax=unclassified Serratia (in: enterobacteria) TaxID=2647522 RepID=UPI000689FE5C|nr:MULTISPECIES: winged helix-turn-helix domain-containing protein [unclassified Serratia (in: enterobacteria)]